jgi:hypothetical protein
MSEHQLRIERRLKLSGVKDSGTSKRGHLSRQRTGGMIAFARDFHVLASHFPTDISAVLLAQGNLAKTWDARTFRHLLIDHLKSPLKVTCEL